MSFPYKCILTALLVLFSTLEAKVCIFAHYFNQPEYIQYQHLLFKKNLLDEYEFFVFEDSSDPKVAAQIKNECQKYGITHIQVPRSSFEVARLPIFDSYVDLFSPSFECAVATQYIYENYVIPSKDICLILDNDIFLLSPFSIEQYLGGASFSYIREIKGTFPNEVPYMLPNFLILNPSLMPEKELLSFNLGTILGNRTDSGGYSYFYLCDHGCLGSEMARYYLCNTPSKLKERFCNRCPLLFTSRRWSSHWFIGNELFLHIRMGSNWSKDPSYPEMKREIEILFKTLLEDY